MAVRTTQHALREVGDTPDSPQRSLLRVLLKIKRPFKEKGKQVFEINKIAPPKSLIQAETQIMFRLGNKDNGY